MGAVVSITGAAFEPGLPVQSAQAFEETAEIYLWVASRNEWIVAPEEGEDIIDIEQYRPGQRGWTQGPYRCLGCRLQWRGVAPVGMPAECECPRCGLEKGVAVSLCADLDNPSWKCDCGSFYFQIRKDSVLCIRCGNRYEAEEVWP
jgi:hypothetical protein